jgi:hypothetical protein
MTHSTGAGRGAGDFAGWFVQEWDGPENELLRRLSDHAKLRLASYSGAPEAFRDRLLPENLVFEATKRGLERVAGLGEELVCLPRDAPIRGTDQPDLPAVRRYIARIIDNLIADVFRDGGIVEPISGGDDSDGGPDLLDSPLTRDGAVFSPEASASPGTGPDGDRATRLSIRDVVYGKLIEAAEAQNPMDDIATMQLAWFQALAHDPPPSQLPPPAVVRPWMDDPYNNMVHTGVQWLMRHDEELDGMGLARLRVRQAWDPRGWSLVYNMALVPTRAWLAVEGPEALALPAWARKWAPMWPDVLAIAEAEHDGRLRCVVDPDASARPRGVEAADLRAAVGIPPNAWFSHGHALWALAADGAPDPHRRAADTPIRLLARARKRVWRWLLKEAGGSADPLAPFEVDPPFHLLGRAFHAEDPTRSDGGSR